MTAQDNQAADATTAPTMVVASAEPLDPLGDLENTQVKNRAKVGSARPSSLLYT
ncbi:MAG: hypothetical protein GXX79_16830, partial [Actinomycetales bacterium]|nr:hypothetical protein [Actinomycetales bacterium]